MTATTTSFELKPQSWSLPDRGKVAMTGLIIAESAVFTIFVVAYLFYIDKDLAGPTPREVLEIPVFYTICLLSSSLTIHLAAKSLARNRRNLFFGFWLVTIALGGAFLYGTAQEWHRLIYEHGLTISTNLFGTTYYSLVGLHAFHVTVGLIMLSLVEMVGLAGFVRAEHAKRIDVLSMYWHFVDAVWVVVFTIVYVLGR
jgi:cytochrome c oxidase subunit 3/cytochrome o ubiquinol oxidase subunit 3